MVSERTKLTKATRVMWTKAALVVTLSFSLGFFLLRTVRRATPAYTRPGEGLIGALSRSEQNTTISEIMVIYVGSSRCGWCNDPRLPPAVSTVIDSVQSRAARANAYTTLVGVDTDVAHGRETQHLSNVGAFDQMALGGGYLNIVAREVSWGVLAGANGTPQVLVLRRPLRKSNLRGEPLSIQLQPATLLARKVGLYEILTWTRMGVPMANLQ